MLHRGAIVLAHEFDEYWCEKFLKSSLNTLGIHPPGGIPSITKKTMRDALEFFKSEKFKKLYDLINNC